MHSLYVCFSDHVLNRVAGSLFSSPLGPLSCAHSARAPRYHPACVGIVAIASIVGVFNCPQCVRAPALLLARPPPDDAQLSAAETSARDELAQARGVYASIIASENSKYFYHDAIFTSVVSFEIPSHCLFFSRLLVDCNLLLAPSSWTPRRRACGRPTLRRAPQHAPPMPSSCVRHSNS